MPTTRRSGQISNPGAFGQMYTQQAPGSSATTWGYAPDGGLMGYNRATGRAVPISGAMPEANPDMNPVGLSGLLGSSAPMPPERPAGLGGPTWADNFAPQYDTTNTTGQNPSMLADAVQMGQVGASGFWGVAPGWGDTALASKPPAMANVPPPEALSGYPTSQDFETQFPGLLSWMPSLPDWGTLSPATDFDTTYWGTPQMASTGDLSQLPQVPTPPVRPFDLGVKPIAPAAAAQAPGMAAADMASKGAYGTASNPLSPSYMAKFGLGDASPAQLAAAQQEPYSGGLGDAGTSGWGQTAMGVGGGLLGGLAGGPLGAVVGGLAGRYAGGLLGMGSQPGQTLGLNNGHAYGTPQNPLSPQYMAGFGLGDATPGQLAAYRASGGNNSSGSFGGGFADNSRPGSF